MPEKSSCRTGSGWRIWRATTPCHAGYPAGRGGDLKGLLQNVEPLGGHFRGGQQAEDGRVLAFKKAQLPRLVAPRYLGPVEGGASGLSEPETGLQARSGASTAERSRALVATGV